MPITKSPTSPKGWFAAGSHPGSYDMSLCKDTCHSGTSCARIQSVKSDIDGFGTLMQSLMPTLYLGKLIKLTAYIKSEGVVDWAGMWMRIDEGKKIVAFDNMQGRPIQGDTDWNKYEIMLNIPNSATNMSFGVLLSGKGTVWFDDLEIDCVAADTKVTDPYRSCGVRFQNPQPTNLDFSKGLRAADKDEPINKTPVGWFTQTHPADDVKIILDKLTPKDEQSVLIRSELVSSSGAILQSVAADDYIGKRIRLSAQVKTSETTGQTGLFLRADAGYSLSVCFDYMDGRKIFGTTDWTEHQCVIDVPIGSDNIYIGGTLSGEGTVWYKNFKLEVVGQDIPTTGANGSSPSANEKKKKKKTAAKSNKTVNLTPTNLDFGGDGAGTARDAKQPPNGWYASGSNPENFKMAIDPNLLLEGSRCAFVEAKSDEARGFGTLMQTVDAEFARGKRLRLSAQIKSEEVDWAALWMRIDGEDDEVLGFDNMQNNPIKDTTDWNYYECVLDVPDASKNIAFGVLLSDKGKVWFSKVALTEVPKEVDTTDIKEILSKPSGPQNLNFEDN